VLIFAPLHSHLRPSHLLQLASRPRFGHTTGLTLSPLFKPSTSDKTPLVDLHQSLFQDFGVVDLVLACL
jgi:hypothetical protein